MKENRPKKIERLTKTIIRDEKIAFIESLIKSLINQSLYFDIIIGGDTFKRLKDIPLYYYDIKAPIQFLCREYEKSPINKVVFLNYEEKRLAFYDIANDDYQAFTWSESFDQLKLNEKERKNHS